MRPTIRPRRVLIGAAAAAAAIALPVAALASPGRSTDTARTTAARTTAAATAVTRCGQSQLTAWLGTPGDAAAGSTYYQLELSNISRRACTLFGYPGVSALTSSRQDGSAAQRTASHPSTTITLQPGATVHSILQITDTGAFGAAACKPVAAGTLRVFAPGDFNALQIPTSLTACSKKGPAYLHVTAVIAGAGIPGFSS